MTPKYLTKSRFKLAVECPTKLYYASNPHIYKNTKQDDSFLAILAEGGYQVGELAKCLYPGGIEISAKTHADAEALTLDLLRRENVILFEPAIRFGDFYVRIDILVKSGNSFQLIEVKAKSYDSNQPKLQNAKGQISTPMRPYIEDIAFQYFVLQSAFPLARINSFLMMPDKAIRASIDGLNQMFKIEKNDRQTKIHVHDIALGKLDAKVLALVNVDDFVEQVMRNGVEVNGTLYPLQDAAYTWVKAYANNQRIAPVPGAQCAKCEFTAKKSEQLKSGFKECWSSSFGLSESDFDQGTVLDLWNFRKKDQLIKSGKVQLKSVTKDDLGQDTTGIGLSASDRQWLQVAGIPNKEDRGGYWIDENLMKAAFSTWTYPYHLIDFETSSAALPFHKGMRPYEQVAFQFSHHILYADGRVEHAGEFLETEAGKFPNFAFARTLKRQLENDCGSIFMWSTHENTILNRIIVQLNESSSPPADAAELSVFLSSLTKGGEREMIDLCDLSKRAYFHVDTKGSNSIKKVLPSILNSSSLVQQKYSSPIYGGTIPSKNYKNFVWVSMDQSGQVIDPYQKIKDYADDLLGNELIGCDDTEELVIAEGGAAATAYARLQFESIDFVNRNKINAALLRYCELDTLAMVMILEGWREMSGLNS